MSSGSPDEQPAASRLRPIRRRRSRSAGRRFIRDLESITDADVDNPADLGRHGVGELPRGLRGARGRRNHEIDLGAATRLEVGNETFNRGIRIPGGDLTVTVCAKR